MFGAEQLQMPSDDVVNVDEEDVKITLKNTSSDDDNRFSKLLQSFHQNAADVIIKCTSTSSDSLPMSAKDASENTLRTSSFLLGSCSHLLRKVLTNQNQEMDDVTRTIILVDHEVTTVRNFVHLMLNGSVNCCDQRSLDELVSLTRTLKAGFATDEMVSKVRKRKMSDLQSEKLYKVSDTLPSLEQVLVKSEPAPIEPTNVIAVAAIDDVTVGGDEIFFWDEVVNQTVEVCNESKDFSSNTSSSEGGGTSSTSFLDEERGKPLTKKRIKKSFKEGTTTGCCRICGHNFISDVDQVEHLELHLKENLDDKPKLSLLDNNWKSVDCVFCYRSLGARSKLIAHLENHLDELYDQATDGSTILRCKKCRLQFRSLNELLMHQQLHELEKKAEQQCDLCGLVSKQPLTAHKKAVHHQASAQPNYHREVCFKRLHTETGLRYHLQLHGSKLGVPEEEALPPMTSVEDGKEGKLLICDICGFKTHRKTGFESHFQTHLDTKRYQCDQCDQSFSVKYLLNNHLRKHKGETPVLCDICGKGFTYAAHMKGHKALVHSKVFLYQCTICSVKLKSWQIARKHVLIHSDVKPYHCSHCKMSFGYQSEIDQHRKRGHGAGVKFQIKKVLLPIHKEIMANAIRKINPEPIPTDLKVAHRFNKADQKEVRLKKYDYSKSGGCSSNGLSLNELELKDQLAQHHHQLLELRHSVLE